MNRRATIAALLALGASATALGVRAQSSERPRRIGILGFANPVAGKAYLDAFADELAKLGWVEGRNIVTTYVYAQGDVGRMDALAAELLALKPDLIFTTNDPGALALKRATSTVPIVFASISDPVALGLVKSLRHPGGNLTGQASAQTLETIGKRLQLLKEWFPRLSRISIMFSQDDRDNTFWLGEFRRYAAKLGMQAVELNVRDVQDIDVAFGKLQRDGVGALYVFSNALTYTHRETIFGHALAARVPTISSTTNFADAGGLIAYGSRPEDLARGGAWYVDRILRGAKPADLPVQQPTRYELVINAKTAKALGLTIPQSLLIQADRVIE